MNGNENINVGDIKTQSLKDRFNGFIKQKLMIIILTLGCLIFVLKDAIKYGKSSEEVIVLGLDFVVTYAFTLYITTIMGKMGLKAGINSINYIQTMAYYSRAKEETESIRSLLPRYCEIKNEEEIKSIQREILYQENLFIDKLNDYKQSELTKKQWKAVIKARKVKIIKLIDKDLISERGRSLHTKYSTYLGKKQSTFEKQNFVSNAITKLTVPLALSFLSVEAIIWSNILSGLVKTLLILFGAIINYFTNEEFATNELRNRFINKADALFDFKNLYEKKPELFK